MHAYDLISWHFYFFKNTIVATSLFFLRVDQVCIHVEGHNVVSILWKPPQRTTRPVKLALKLHLIF